MENNRVTEILEECDALLKGHFRYTSGRHGNMYFEKIRVAGRPDLVMELGGLTAELMGDIRDNIDTVCAPAFGAIVFGFATAHALRKPFAFLQRNSSGEMCIRPGFLDRVAGARVLLIEDVVTTGGSVSEAISVLEEAGAEVVMAGLLVDRTGGKLLLPVPYRALLTVTAESWEPLKCPLCMEGIPMETPGSSGKRVLPV
jgi:orotate phosphoribosyltransferase